MISDNGRRDEDDFDDAEEDETLDGDLDKDETLDDDLDDDDLDDDDLDDDEMPDIGGDTMVDVTGELIVDDLFERVSKSDPDEAAHRREIRRRLEEIAERRQSELDDTFNFNFDDDT